MKKVLFILLAVVMCNCSSDDYNSNDNQDPEATILGRWVLQGFEQNIRVEFTETKKFTIYGSDGSFPTLEEFNLENPQLLGNDWYYEGDAIVVDLNFGNFSVLTPEFVCGNYAVKMLNENGETHSIYYREGYDISNCSDIE